MLTVEVTEAFDTWRAALDSVTRARVGARLTKLSRGLWGDCKAVGGDVIELREHYGPGLRLYAMQRGSVVVVMLAGGSKRGQQRDIQRAIELAAQLKE